MKKPKDAISIVNYFDYREYLRDVYDSLKLSRHGYSFRVFASEAGISSHNFLPRIIRRERNLSEEFVLPLCVYLKLSAKEEKYFYALVKFNNAKKIAIKEKHLKELLALRVVNEEFKLNDTKLRFFEKWYYPVVRELVTICDFKDDYHILARHCIPRITALQARGAVEFLIKNGFIKKNANERFEVIDAIIATEPEVDSAIIPKYHKITLQQCVAAVDTVKKEDRNFSSSTLRVSRAVYEEIKQEIYHFRKKLLSMAKECKNPEMVCFTGFQLLPRSEVTPKNGNKVK